MNAADSTPVVEIRGLTKSFGGSLALDQVDLSIKPGKIHGLLGENGSGKSTLIKVLAGFHTPDSGSLKVNGRQIAMPVHSSARRDLGFEFVHQDLGLVPNMTVTENLFLERIVHSHGRFFTSWRALARRAEEVIADYGLSLDPSAPIDDLKPVERAMLAIIRALEGLRRSRTDEPTLLVLDEPTVFLPAQEVDLLFDFLRDITKGRSSVLFVSHDLAEVRQITDEITVLRDGKVAGNAVTAQTSPDELVHMIVGHELADVSRAHAEAVEQRPVLLEVAGLSTSALRDMSFQLHEGEVLGFTGLVGSGYEEVCYGLFGALHGVTGRMDFRGREVDLRSLTPRDAIALKFALVPADRQGAGSVPTLTVAENITLLILDEYFRGMRLRQRQLDERAQTLMGTFDIRPPRIDLEYGNFSGGNQQKALLAKWQEIEPAVLLLHEPTQGVDVGARQQIWDMIRTAAYQGATICASSDYEQIAAVCDRVVIVARGRPVGILTGADMTKERISDTCLRSSLS